MQAEYTKKSGGTYGYTKAKTDGLIDGSFPG